MCPCRWGKKKKRFDVAVCRQEASSLLTARSNYSLMCWKLRVFLYMTSALLWLRDEILTTVSRFRLWLRDEILTTVSRFLLWLRDAVLTTVSRFWCVSLVHPPLWVPIFLIVGANKKNDKNIKRNWKLRSPSAARLRLHAVQIFFFFSRTAPIFFFLTPGGHQKALKYKFLENEIFF